MPGHPSPTDVVCNVLIIAREGPFIVKQLAAKLRISNQSANLTCRKLLDRCMLKRHRPANIKGLGKGSMAYVYELDDGWRNLP